MVCSMCKGFKLGRKSCVIELSGVRAGGVV